MERIINKCLDLYFSDKIYIKKLEVFCSSPVEINYYFFSKHNILQFEIVKRGDSLEYPRKAICTLVENLIAVDPEISFPYICKWFSNHQKFLDILNNNKYGNLDKN